jgi:cell division protein FtsB
LTVAATKSVLEIEMIRRQATRPNTMSANFIERLQLKIGWRKVATVAAGFLAVALGYHVIFGQNGLTVYEQKREENRSLNKELQRLQVENDLLKGHVDHLQSDPNAIEHQAREELHYTRPGEVIYTLPDSPSGQSGSKRPGQN